MKINKLFHWLYALLMLLPIFAIGFTCAYVTFNKNAYQSYYGETINNATYTHTNYSDLVVGETYQINPVNIGAQSSEMGSSVYKININNVKAVNFTPSINFNSAVAFSIYSTISGVSYVNLIDSNNTNVLSISSSSNYIIQYQLVSKNLLATSITLFDLLNNNLVEYNKYSYLDNVFYYSLDEMKNNPLFSWANNNFLTNPFSYLFNLFGVPSNSGIMTLLSYWLDISIIWLVFDLVMYVPLLAHRWIDKGMVD